MKQYRVILIVCLLLSPVAAFAGGSSSPPSGWNYNFQTNTLTPVGGAGVSVTVAIDCHANCSPTAAQLTSGAVLYNTGQTTGNSAVTLPAVSGWSTGSFSLDVTATTTGMPVGNITVSSTTANICLDEACGTTYTTLTVTTPTADTSLVCRAFGNGADIHCYSVGAMSATGS
jgi:hypothetical protein